LAQSIAWTVPLALDLAAPRGRVILFGIYPEATLSPLTLLRNGLTFVGDVAVLPSQFLRAIRWLEYKKVQVEPLVTRRFTLDQAREGLAALHRGNTVKVLFEM